MGVGVVVVFPLPTNPVGVAVGVRVGVAVGSFNPPIPFVGDGDAAACVGFAVGDGVFVGLSAASTLSVSGVVPISTFCGP